MQRITVVDFTTKRNVLEFVAKQITPDECGGYRLYNKECCMWDEFERYVKVGYGQYAIVTEEQMTATNDITGDKIANTKGNAKAITTMRSMFKLQRRQT